MTSLLIFIISFFISNILYAVSSALASWVLGVKVETIGIFLGPCLKQFNFGFVNLRINLIPLGTYIQLNDEQFSNLPPLKKIPIIASGCLSNLLLAILCLGYIDALQSFYTTFGQVFLCILPTKIPYLLSLMVNFISNNTIISTLGVTSSKLSAFNLFPLPFLAGGQIIFEILKLVTNHTPYKLNDELIEKLNAASLLISFLIILFWIIAIFYKFLFGAKLLQP